MYYSTIIVEVKSQVKVTLGVNHNHAWFYLRA